jgi:hypothetical protein
MNRLPALVDLTHRPRDKTHGQRVIAKDASVIGTFVSL